MEKMRRRMERQRQRKEKLVLRSLQLKYNETFEIVSYQGRSWGLATDIWTVQPSGTPSRRFTVLGQPLAKEYRLSDSYCRHALLNEYRQLILDFLQPRVGNCKVDVQMSSRAVMPDHIRPGMSLRECLGTEEGSCGWLRARIHIALNTEQLGERSLESLLGDLGRYLAHLGLRAWISCSLHSQAGEAKRGECGKASCYIDRQRRLHHLDRSKSKAALLSRPLDIWQIERLCSIVYLDSLLHNIEGDLGDVLRYTVSYASEDNSLNDEPPCWMTEAEWAAVIQDILADPQLSSLRILDVLDIQPGDHPGYEVLPGQRVLCFGDDAGRAYAIFRGTYGDAEWLDNARGMTEADTVQQKAAARYIAELRARKELGICHLTVAGHSKGGNKALYATIVLPSSLIDRCVSLDGQGFSQAFHRKYAKNIAERLNTLELIAEQRDFANALGFPIKPNEYYRGRRGFSTSTYPYGEPLPFYHCPDALRGQLNLIGPGFSDGAIPRALQSYIGFMLSDSRYADRSEEIAEDIISLIMQSSDVTIGEQAAALARLFYGFCDLLVHDDSFVEQLYAVLTEEAGALLATLDSLEQPIEESDSEAGKLSLHLFARLVIGLFLPPRNLSNLCKALRILLGLLDRAAEEQDCLVAACDGPQRKLRELLVCLSEESKTSSPSEELAVLVEASGNV